MTTATAYRPSSVHQRQQDELETLRALGAEQPASVARKCVELLLYLSLANSAFLSKTGLGMVARAGAIPVIATACLAVAFMLFQRIRLPISVWAAIVFNLGANISAVVGQGAMPIMDDSVRSLVPWLCHTINFCYVAQNRAAQKRMLIFVSILTILAVEVGGRGYGYRVERLRLEEVGGSFANANQLAHLSGDFAVALLFWSLRANKAFRPVLWGLALALIYILFLTVSRGGILLFCCGILMLVLAIMSARGARLGGVVLIGVGLIVATQFAFLFARSAEDLSGRFGERSSRTRVYSLSTVGQMAGTLFVGAGPEGAYVSSAGITAHNTFINTHLSYGGITAWPYLAWLAILAFRTLRMLRAKDYSADLRFMVLAMFGMMLGEHLFTNFGFSTPSAMYALAITEKYTAPYSRKRMLERQAQRTYTLAYAPRYPAITAAPGY